VSTDARNGEQWLHDVLVRGEPRADGYAHFDPDAGVFIWCGSAAEAADLVSEMPVPQYVLQVVEIYPAGRRPEVASGD